MKIFTRFRILNATRALVSELGVERVTMRGIARLANITAPAIYKHFRNKRALLEAVIASGYDELDTEMIRGLQAPAPHDGLHVMVKETVAYALRYPRLFEMMVAPRTRDHKVVDRLKPQIATCMRAGALEWGNADDIALTIWAQMRGVLSLRHDRGERGLRHAWDTSMHRLMQPLARA